MKTKEGLNASHNQQIKLIIKLFLYPLFFLALSEISMLVFDTPSRRLCNFSWITYQCFICTTMCIVAGLADRVILNKSNTNICMQSINLNALLTFIGCNLLCGLINITTQTLFFSFNEGLFILYMYCLIPSLVFGWCCENNIRLAF